MSALQSSFNSNRHWPSNRLTGDFGYFKNTASLSRTPANQPFRPAAVTAAAKTRTGREDHLMIYFLVFFVIYAVCRIIL